MTKIVVSRCFGGFGLSEEAVRYYAALKGITLYPEKGPYSSLAGPTWYIVPKDKRTPKINWQKASTKERIAYNEAYSKEVFSDIDTPRDDPALIKTVEDLGKAASNRFSDLQVVEIPDDVKWVIDEYDGLETVKEEHRSW